MMHPPERDWMLVAPWWQWTDPASIPAGAAAKPDPRAGRLSRPIIQKYDSANVANDFIKDPQRCLRFVEEDLVHALQAAPTPSASKTGRLFRLGASGSGSSIVDQRYVPDGTGT